VTTDALFHAESLAFSYASSGTRGPAGGDEARAATLLVDELDVHAGEFVAFVGGNGAGKTTLLKLLNGLLEPGSGRLLFRGRPFGSGPRSPIRRHTVLVHQQPYLFSGSVGWNVGYGLRIRRFDAGQIRRRVEEKLGLVGLPGLGHRRAAELSGGERQRVALARALVLEPEVLMLDEPTAHMDPASIDRLEDALRTLHGASTTVLMSTHQLSFAYRLAERIVVMDEGRIVPTRENIFKGEVARRDGYFLYFETEGGELKCPDRQGAFTTAVVSTDDVFVSRGPVETSAQNRFAGTVVSLERCDHLVQVRMDCGFPLTACLTDRSVESLGIEPGAELAAAFKASAVRLY